MVLGPALPLLLEQVLKDTVHQLSIYDLLSISPALRSDMV